MTNEQNAPYEALTTVEDVQRALEDDRVVELTAPGNPPVWVQTLNDRAQIIADDLEAGWQYRAAAPKPAAPPSVTDAVRVTKALLVLERLADKPVNVSFREIREAKLYLHQLEALVYLLTGDEGEDDALVVLQRYVEEREQCDVAALVDRLKRNDPVDDAAIKAATDALVAFLGQPELQVCMRESAQRSWGMRHAIAAALPLLLPEAALTHPGHKEEES